MNLPSPAAVSTTRAAPRRAGVRFMVSHPAHLLALGFGSGLSPLAPGTVGSLWAWLTFTLLRPWLDDFAFGMLLGAGAVIGCWASTVTARRLGTADPSSIVWDEVIAFWLVLWLITPAGWLAQAAAFALFRYFDAAKPGPVGWADRRFKGQAGAPIGWWQGFGVMVDDLVAAGCCLLAIAIWRWW
jgi:phosphatidylglycerophosphatase A